MLANAKSKPVANPLRFDPSRTTALRRAFGADMLRRISALKSAIYQLIVVEDAFGHRPPQRFTVNTRFKFLTDDEKLKAFNRWFENEVKRGVLQVDHQGKPWTAKYVDSAYRKGRINAYLQAHREEYEKGTDWLLGGREQFLRSAFMQPETVQTLRLLGTRNFEQLKGITSDMSSQLNRILASGIAAGRAPQVIAREINKSIDGINKRRARLLASTELAYAQSEGQLDSFEDLGVKEVGIKAEWTTAGDNRVCERCNALSGMVFKIKQARGLIPLHPQCVTGDMHIESPSPLALTRSVFTGRIIEILTAKGRRLSVTENHVLLTHRGWVKAKFLTEADKLVDASSIGGLSFQTPNDNHNVPTIEESFHSLSEFGEIYSISCSDTRPEYFHGDAGSFNGKIDIVRFDGFLGNQLQSFFGSNRKHFQFVSGDVSSRQSLALMGQCDFSANAVRAAAAADCFMGFQSVSSVFFRGSVAHHQSVGCQLVSDGNACINHPSSYKSSFKSEPSAEFWERNPGLVELDHLIKNFWRNKNSIIGIAKNTVSNPVSVKMTSQCFGLDTDTGGNAVDSFSQFLMSSSKFFNVQGIQWLSITSVKSRHVVDLPVYDVSTLETMYNCNGILSSNCRCAWSPVYDVKASKLRRRQIKALGGPLLSPRLAAVQDADQKISRVEAQLDATYGVKVKLPRERPSKAIDYARLVEQEMAKIQRHLPKVVEAEQPLELKLTLPLARETPKETGEAFRKEIARQIWDQRLTEAQKSKVRELLRTEEINKRVLGTARSPKGKWQALFAAYTAKEALQKLLPEAFTELVKQWFE